MKVEEGQVNVMGDDTFGGEVEESLFVLLDDEAESSHIFGDQSMNSDQNKHTRRISFRSRRPSKASAWHGSCASFHGNNSELLNLSSSGDESNASCMYLTLYKHDEVRKNTTATTTFGDNQGNGRLEQDLNKGMSKEKCCLKNAFRQRRFEEKYSTSVVTALNESSFNSSKLMQDGSDQLPRKPNRDELVINVDIDDDDGTDADFTDIITVNLYESICATPEEPLPTMERSFEESSPILDDTLVKITGSQSIPDTYLPRKPTFLESFDRNTISSIHGNSSPFQSTKERGVHKEDEAPKLPTRGPSPPRV